MTPVMKFRALSTMALSGSLLSSCFYYSPPAPYMPYNPHRPSGALVLPAGVEPGPYVPGPAEDGWHSTPPPAEAPAPPPPAEAPVPSRYPVPAPAPMPAPAPAAPLPRPSTAITQPQMKLNPVTPKPAAPAPRPAAPAASAAKDPKSITNNGPIPVATPVPGDPTRVYNPLDSSKTIRITDKNGKVYPSGKELKVRGTNFHFYVP